jgi:predicted kinase
LEFGFWERPERDALLRDARSLRVGVELHFLDVPLDELWRRLDGRNQRREHDTPPVTRSDLEEWAAHFQAPTADELALFDSPQELTERDFTRD